MNHRSLGILLLFFVEILTVYFFCLDALFYTNAIFTQVLRYNDYVMYILLAICNCSNSVHSLFIFYCIVLYNGVRAMLASFKETLMPLLLWLDCVCVSHPDISAHQLLFSVRRGTHLRSTAGTVFRHFRLHAGMTSHVFSYILGLDVVFRPCSP